MYIMYISITKWCIYTELYDLLIIKNVYENMIYMTYKKWRKIFNIFSGMYCWSVIDKNQKKL